MMILDLPCSRNGRINLNGIILSSLPQISNTSVSIMSSLLLYLGALALPFNAEINASFAPGKDNLLKMASAYERLTIELSIDVNISLTSFEDFAFTIPVYFFNSLVPLKVFGREPAGLMRISLSTTFLFRDVNSTAIWPPREEPIMNK